MLHDDSPKFEKNYEIEGVLLDAAEPMAKVDALRKKPEGDSDERKQEGAANNGMNATIEQSAATMESVEGGTIDNGMNATVEQSAATVESVEGGTADNGMNVAAEQSAATVKSVEGGTAKKNVEDQEKETDLNEETVAIFEPEEVVGGVSTSLGDFTLPNLLSTVARKRKREHTKKLHACKF
ncbi:hypothetical protein L7F22_068934 [Adiantum nelumboides]|nr:hypothetical protein [Adiantum nelumboides]